MFLFIKIQCNYLFQVQLQEIDELVVDNASSSTPKTISYLCLPLYGEPKTIFPHCQANLLPEVNIIFDTLDDGLCFYKNYANASGFEVRRFGEKNSNGVIMIKYCVCNR